MRSLFEKNLMRMKQELTDLKTAHRRGLGTIRFFRHRITFTTSTLNYVTIRGNIADGEPGHPLVQVYARGTNDSAPTAYGMRCESHTGYILAVISSGYQTTITADIFCSSALSSLEVI